MNELESKQDELIEFLVIHSAELNFDDEERIKFRILQSKIAALKQGENELLSDLYNAWPTKDVLTKLIWATEYLLDEKSYDGHGHEELNLCVKRGKEILTRLKQQGEPVSAEKIKHKIYDKIRDDLIGSRLEGWNTDDGDKYPLVDYLSKDTTIKHGLNEIDNIVEQIEIEDLLKEYASQQGEKAEMIEDELIIKSGSDELRLKRNVTNCITISIDTIGWPSFILEYNNIDLLIKYLKISKDNWDKRGYEIKGEKAVSDEEINKWAYDESEQNICGDYERGIAMGKNLGAVAMRDGKIKQPIK